MIIRAYDFAQRPDAPVPASEISLNLATRALRCLCSIAKGIQAPSEALVDLEADDEGTQASSISDLQQIQVDIMVSMFCIVLKEVADNGFRTFSFGLRRHFRVIAKLSTLSVASFVPASQKLSPDRSYFLRRWSPSSLRADGIIVLLQWLIQQVYLSRLLAAETKRSIYQRSSVNSYHGFLAY